jgi:hypothetical protein
LVSNAAAPPSSGVTDMQFNRHGARVWRQARALLESEHTRRAVGEVAVPYGCCSEPSNVAACSDGCLYDWPVARSEGEPQSAR